MTSINPYLTFNDRCQEAFDFYKSVFGGDFNAKMKFNDVPSEHAMPESEGNKIMHISLPIGKNSFLMGSDTPEVMGKVIEGNNITVSIHPETEEEARHLFDGLSAGGKVSMPLEKTFWNAYYGSFTDKFGIKWLLNYDLGSQQ